MPKPPPPEQPLDPADASLEDSFYEVPADLEDGGPTVRTPLSGEPPPPPDPDPNDEPELRPRRGLPVLKIGIALGVVVVALAGVLVYRARERSRAVDQGLAEAEKLLRLDTAEGYRKAAEFLKPIAQLDPIHGGSARAFALAMLAADYRDAQAAADAGALLLAPSHERQKPSRAAQAFVALRLSTGALGDATSELGYTDRTELWSRYLDARIALRAGSPEAALDPANAAGQDLTFAPGLAVQGDVLRRTRDPGPAERAYGAALAVSPTQPRAVYGVAKLALAGDASPDLQRKATAALQRLLADAGTPARERARAALHLTALRLRAGDGGAEAALDDPTLGLDDAGRTWVRRAAAAEAANKGTYRAVTGAPAAAESVSDDDPGELRPLVPPPPPPPPAAEPAPEPPRPAVTPAAHHGKIAKMGKAATSRAKASAKGKPGAKPAGKASKAAAKKRAPKKAH